MEKTGEKESWKLAKGVPGGPASHARLHGRGVRECESQNHQQGNQNDHTTAEQDDLAQKIGFHNFIAAHVGLQVNIKVKTK
jgi:hypothetical protein